MGARDLAGHPGPVGVQELGQRGRAGRQAGEDLRQDGPGVAGPALDEHLQGLAGRERAGQRRELGGQGVLLGVAAAVEVDRLHGEDGAHLPVGQGDGAVSGDGDAGEVGAGARGPAGQQAEAVPAPAWQAVLPGHGHPPGGW